MKKLIFTLTFFAICFCSTNNLLAEQQVVVVGDSLAVYEVEVIKTLINKYPQPPAEVPLKTALKIMKYGQGKFVQKNKPQTKYSFSFYPLMIKSGDIFKQTIWRYASGKWLEPITKNIWTTKKFNLRISILALYIVFFCILIISFTNRFLREIKKRNKKILIFYVVIIGISVLAALLGYLIVGEVGVFVGVFAGLFVGVFAGPFVGVFVGGYAGFFAGENFTTAINYLIFLFFACLISYLLATIAFKLKIKIFAKKLAETEIKN